MDIAVQSVKLNSIIVDKKGDGKFYMNFVYEGRPEKDEIPFNLKVMQEITELYKDEIVPIQYTPIRIIKKSEKEGVLVAIGHCLYDKWILVESGETIRLEDLKKLMKAKEIILTNF